MKVQKLSNLKQIVSLAEMAEMLSISRSRFYQLLDANILPQPIFCLRTKRPLYTQELQQKCLEVKESNVGINGQYILFYSARKKKAKAKKEKQIVNPMHQEYSEILASMGLEVSISEVENAINELYPTGIGNHKDGIVIRELFRKLKSN